MANDVHVPPENTAPSDAGEDARGAPERGISKLLTGILADVQSLIEQQLTLFRQELRSELRKGKQAAATLAFGAGIAAVGAAMILVMLPLLLSWAVPELPLWACFGLVGGLLAAVGCCLVYVAVRKFESLDPLSNQAVEAFKENFTWTTRPRIE